RLGAKTVLSTWHQPNGIDLACRIVMHCDVFLCVEVGGAWWFRPGAPVEASEIGLGASACAGCGPWPVAGRVVGAIGQFSAQKVSDCDHHLGIRPRWRRMSRSSCRRSVHFATRMTVQPADLRAFTRSMSVAHWFSDVR